MSINQEQQKIGLKWLGNIHRQHFSNSSEAAKWWDSLTPAWRGVVLHAAAVNSGLSVFKSHLSKCSWRELFERLDYQAMIHLRNGISRARLTMNGFGSLRDRDFSKCTANRPVKKANPIYANCGPQMIIAARLLNNASQQENL